MKLNAHQRELTGKRSHRLLREGQVPGIVYGHHVKATPVAVDRRELQHVLQRAGRTQLVDLVIESGRPHKVLIKAVQTHPRRQGPIHVDFQQVSMREKLQVEVPVVVVGESPAVERGDADILQVVHQLKVECLPNDIPEVFEIDVSTLANVGDQVRIGDVPGFEGVTVLGDPEDVVVKAQPRRELVTEEELAEEAAIAAEAAVEAAAEEGQAEAAEEEGQAEEAEGQAQSTE
ncbi:MAG TPA: 50S ribosomal protein L25 [Candidatus Dormibacteraeota bacterium]